MSDPVYPWPWNDDDRNWIPEVLDSGILWSTYSPTIDVGDGDLILDSLELKNQSPQDWNEQGNAEGSWDDANDDSETIWTDTKEQDNKWNQI